MARKTSRRHAQGDASRQRILDAVLALAGERGYVGTTLALIKQRTGLPTSALYWHFDSKEDILADALTYGFDRWNEHRRWDEAPSTAQISAEGIEPALLRNLRDATLGIEHEPGFWRMGLMLTLETGPAVGGEARERFVKIRSEALGILETWWRAAAPDTGHDICELARITLAGLDGLFLCSLSDGSTDIDELLALFARGLAALPYAGRTALPPIPRPGQPPAASASAASAAAWSGRDRLLDAARDVAAESGYEGASISRICRAAGLPASSLYWHFANKDDLFAAVVEHSYGAWAAEQAEWRPPTAGRDVRADLRELVTSLVTGIGRRPAFLRIGYMLLLLRRTEPAPGRDRFVDVRHRRRRHTAAWFRGAGASAGSAALRAELLMALSDGLLISRMIDVPEWQPVLTGDLLTHVLTAGL